MGREIRRVPPNWEHPKCEQTRIKRGQYVRAEEYQPLYDEPFAPAMREWYSEWQQWDAKTHADYDPEYPNYWDYNGGPPDPKYYRPDWPEETMTWFQIYETVSEGTPVTPPFATKAELIDYLVDNGDFWDQNRWKERVPGYGPPAWDRKNAEAFVKDEWAPSMVASVTAAGVDIRTARDGFPHTSKEDHQ